MELEDKLLNMLILSPNSDKIQSLAEKLDFIITLPSEKIFTGCLEA